MLLIDWKMPAMDGIACAQRIAELTAARQRPPAVLMVSAFSRDELQQRIDDGGLAVAALLTKPVTPSTLFETCSDALGLDVRTVTRRSARQERLLGYRAQLQGARVLLVEDNQINREVAVELLGGMGMTVDTANDGAEALRMLDERPFDVVLMDCQMPVLDGFETTRLLRRRPSLAQLPVIAMTANAMVGDRERALASGMNDHVAKPIDVDALFATLAKWVRRGEPPCPPRTAAAPTSLPVVPGLDLDAALALVGDDARVLRAALLRFADLESGFAASFEQARAAGTPDVALRAIHDLKGNAAQFGMTAVSEAAAAVEQAWSEGDEAALRQRLDRVDALLEPILRGLREWRDQV